MGTKNLERLTEGGARKLCEMEGVDPDKNWQSRAAEVRRHILLASCLKQFVHSENVQRRNRDKAAKRARRLADESVENVVATDRLIGELEP